MPSERIRDLRDLTRLRKELLGEVNRNKNRIHKVLQDANIKISSVLSDIYADKCNKISHEYSIDISEV